MTTIRKLLAGATKAEIVCPVRGEVVRRLTVRGDEVELDAIVVKIELPLDTVLEYEAWDFDRGSLLFRDAKVPGGVGKFCTEGDTLRLEDGSERPIAY